jgi:hypothetical protein
MAQITRLDSFKVPLGGQDIELQQIDYEGGGMSLLRIRIRERSRFTVFDIDPLTAQHWAEAMTRWAGQQAATGDPGSAQPAADSSSGDA